MTDPAPDAKPPVPAPAGGPGVGDRRCERCGSGLPEGATGGTCPACLMAAGLKPPASASSGRPRFAAPPPAELQPHFPDLELLELTGQGGMGAVYRARQRRLDRVVALKVLPPELSGDPAFAERFRREAVALARLSHPHLVTVHDVGETAGWCWILMEHVDGANLRQVLATGSLSAAQALAIVPQLCDALQYAHDQGVVHRDIKPENILMDRRGQVKIADFGLAKLLEAPANDRLTGTGELMGTPHYMAPEQIERSRAVDHRADLYSLGVLLYEMLTGQLPLGRFEAPSRSAGVDPALDAVVHKALERDPARRYQQADEVRTDVERVAAGAPPSAPLLATTTSGGDGFGARNEFDGILLIAGGILCALLAAGLTMDATAKLVIDGRTALEVARSAPSPDGGIAVIALVVAIVTAIGGWHLLHRRDRRWVLVGRLAAVAPVALYLWHPVIGIAASLLAWRRFWSRWDDRAGTAAAPPPAGPTATRAVGRVVARGAGPVAAFIGGCFKVLVALVVAATALAGLVILIVLWRGEPVQETFIGWARVASGMPAEPPRSEAEAWAKAIARDPVAGLAEHVLALPGVRGANAWHQNGTWYRQERLPGGGSVNVATGSTEHSAYRRLLAAAERLRALDREVKPDGTVATAEEVRTQAQAADDAAIELDGLARSANPQLLAPTQARLRAIRQAAAAILAAPERVGAMREATMAMLGKDLDRNPDRAVAIVAAATARHAFTAAQAQDLVACGRDAAESAELARILAPRVTDRERFFAATPAAAAAPAGTAEAPPIPSVRTTSPEDTWDDCGRLAQRLRETVVAIAEGRSRFRHQPALAETLGKLEGETSMVCEWATGNRRQRITAANVRDCLRSAIDLAAELDTRARQVFGGDSAGLSARLQEARDLARALDPHAAAIAAVPPRVFAALVRAAPGGALAATRALAQAAGAFTPAQASALLAAAPAAERADLRAILEEALVEPGIVSAEAAPAPAATAGQARPDQP